MILVLTKEKILAQELLSRLTKLKVRVARFESIGLNFLDDLYARTPTALVVDEVFPNICDSASVDLINSISTRMPVLVLADKNQTNDEIRTREYSSSVTVLNEATADYVLATLDACGAIGETAKKSWRRAVPYYNARVPVNMLTENGGIGILTIDATGFRKIEVEYGTSVYNKVKEVFQKILNEMWGRPGCFRSNDILCRRSDHGNTYYVFLNRSRSTGNLPLPGVLENIADRLGKIIQNALWTEVLSNSEKRRIPSCVSSLPNVVVGFASAMHNPCLNPSQVIESALEISASVAKIQMVRMKDRNKELMHTLIQSDNLLLPNYQAVFHLGNITKDLLDEAKIQESISPFEKYLYGFESLIRVQTAEVQALMGQSRAVLEPRFLRPDVLFSIAKNSKVALELDQACLRHAIGHSNDLPGWLMVNILPRNLYFLEYLRQIFKNRKKIILEVSESEAINNFELVKEVQAEIEGDDIKLAADDFGKGFAGLDRVMEIKPDIIKFDRSLISEIHKDRVKRAYVNGLCEAAKILGTTVLGEGVEKWEEAVVLQDMGVDLIQGFLMHRPEPVEVIMNQLSVGDVAEKKGAA